MDLVTQVIDADFAPVMGAAAALGDTFLNDGRTFLLVTNGAGAPINVTLNVQRASVEVPGLGAVAFADVVTAVPAGLSRYIAVPRGPYNQGNGRVSVEYSAVVTVTVAAIRMPAL